MENEYGNDQASAWADRIAEKYPLITKHQAYMRIISFPGVLVWPGGKYGTNEHKEYVAEWCSSLFNGKNTAS